MPSIRRAAFLFAIACLAVTPPGAQARTLELGDLIERQRQQSEDQVLRDLRLEPFKDPELLMILRSGLIAFAEHDFGETISAARALIDRAPDAPQGHHLLGLALANEGRMDEALDALDSAAAIYEVNTDPLIVKGDILLSRNDWDGARETFLTAAERNPDDWRAHDSLGSIALNHGETAAALGHYEAASANAPAGVGEPRMRLASLYVAADRTDDARKLLQDLADANPSFPEPLIALGRLAFTEGRNDDAAGLFDAAIALEPGSAPLRLFKARAELNAREFADARETLITAIAAFPGDSTLHLELAGLYGLTQDYAASLATFEDGLAKWPGERAFRVGASRAAYRLEDFETALDHAAELAGSGDASASDHMWHGVVLERLGQLDASISAYETALEIDTSNWLAANNLASLLLDQAPERAVELARLALEGSGGAERVELTLARAYLSAGETEKGVSMLRDLAERRKNDALVAYRLGKALIDSGIIDEGRAEVQRAITLDPDFEHASEARAVLSAE